MDARQRAALVSVASNAVLTALKLAAGVYTGSVGIISEVIHSGLDLVAAGVALAAVRLAARPPDEMHRYGHGKVENLSALAEALLILVAAGWIAVEAWHRLRVGVLPQAPGLGAVVMAFSAAVNTAVSRYLFRVARAHDSMALEADALHLSTDVYTSLGVFAGLVLVRFTGSAVLDPLVALAVAVLILRAALRLCWDAVQALLDARLPAQEEADIRTTVEQLTAGWAQVHDLRTRKAGGQRHIDFHLSVAPDAPLANVHALCDRIEDQVQARFPGAQVLIHPEPLPRRPEGGRE